MVFDQELTYTNTQTYLNNGSIEVSNYLTVKLSLLTHITVARESNF